MKYKTAQTLIDNGFELYRSGWDCVGRFVKSSDDGSAVLLVESRPCPGDGHLRDGVKFEAYVPTTEDRKAKDWEIVRQEPSS